MHRDRTTLGETQPNVRSKTTGLDRRQLLKLGLLSPLLQVAASAFQEPLLAKTATMPQAASGPESWTSISPFLRGNFAPVTEERTDEGLEVWGKLPAELNGMVLRNGPNPRFKPLKRYHWFDGDGMVHGVRLQEGRATYLNRYIHTRGFELEAKAGRALYQSITESPLECKAPLWEPRNKNTANTALVHHGGKLLALWEGGNPYELKAHTLETVGEYDFQGGLQHAFTAHPKVDPVTGELLTFGYRISRSPYVSYSVFGPDHRLRHTAPIEIPRPVMMHDFAITEHYSIFLDLPEVFDLWRAFRGHSPLVYAPERGARLGVLPRYGNASQLRWFEIEPCYVFHVMDAWEENQELVVLTCRFPRFPEFLEGEKDAQVTGGTYASLYEWRLNLSTGKVKERALDDQPSEFPQVNPSKVGRQARYGYAVGRGTGGLVKFDLQTGQRLERQLVGRCSEPTFVPHPDASAEDDGWVLSLCYDDTTDKSQLVVLDAATFDPEPVARVLLPVRVPFGFHATWVPNSPDGETL